MHGPVVNTALKVGTGAVDVGSCGAVVELLCIRDGEMTETIPLRTTLGI